MPEQRDLDHLAHLDRLIDAAVGTYADPSFDANLAARVLIRLANQPAHEPRQRWRPWAAVAIPAAICLLLLIHFGLGITGPHLALPMQSARLHSPAGLSVHARPHEGTRGVTERQISRATSRRHLLAAATAPQPLPKLDEFPTPTPLTRQERALAAYVAQTPKAAQHALAQAEHQESPLTVASIHVLPLDALDEVANTN